MTLEKSVRRAIGTVPAMVAGFKGEREEMVSFSSHGRAFAALGLVAAGALIASASHAQVELKTYEDAKGYINVRALTCAQLANTFQEDADFLGVWYSGWWNGRAKRHSINIKRTKEGIHEVIVYCKANPDAKVVDAVEAYVKKIQQGGQ
jgi:HdeA/HdeB family